MAPLVFLSLLCLGFVQFAYSQQCNDTYPYSFVQTVNPKMNSTNKLRLGFVGGYLKAEVDHVLAMTHVINNDRTILPDTEIQIYYAAAATQEQLVMAGMFLMRSLKIQGLISGITSIEARVSQLSAKIFRVPQISGNAVSYQLTNKDEYPYFLRTVPADAFQIEAIIGLFTEMQWKRAIIVYTNDDYGSGYNRLVLAGQAANITFISFGVPTTATNVTLIAPYAADVISAVQEHDYRLFIFYTQYGPGMAMRAALMNANFTGQKYAYVLTAPMTRGPFFYGNIMTSYPVQNGAIFAKMLGQYAATNATQKWNLTMIMPSAWYSVDAVLTFAYATQTLLAKGTNFSAINTNVLHAALLNTSFQGVTGSIYYDANGDRLGQYDIYTTGPNFTTKVAYYNAHAKNYTRFGDYIFGDATTKRPRDGPYLCAACAFGTCVEDVGCVCNEGYYGDACNVERKKGNNTPFVAIIVPCVGVIFLGLLIGIIVYRKKISQLVKQVAEKQRSNINPSDIVMGPRIGRGASGEVFKATFRGTEVAVKKIIAANVDNKVIEEFELEVAIMCGLRHPNIIMFMGSSFTLANKEMLLVMEFMTRGSLHDVLHNPTIELNYDMKLHLACQAAQGMNFLHMSTPAIIHSDLKSHNILLDDKWNARISDFGITKFKGQNTTMKSGSAGSGSSAIGTIFWTAPETLAGIDHSEKSDCYSFGIVLWEIFHRQDPYAGRDPMSVASDVIARNLRPTMSPEVPIEMKDLIKQCWHKEPEQRPTFQEIMNTLRTLALKNPNYMSGVSNDRLDAPQGLVYLVHTSVVSSFAIWSAEPEEMCEAVRLEKQLIRNNSAMYKGYEAGSDLHSFLLAFTSAEDAINFSVATQISLLHVDWPRSIMKVPQCSTVTSQSGQVIWKGLRLRMGIISGVPNCEIDAATGRVVYMGEIVEKVKKMTKSIKSGSILITDAIMQETTKGGVHFMQEVSMAKVGDLNVTARNSVSSPIHEVVVKGLEERENNILQSSGSNHPHVLMDVDEITMPDDTPTKRSDANAEATASWVAQFDDIDLKENLGKGSTGDYHRGIWKGKEVAVKTLMNQKMKEDDLLKLTGDAAHMSTLSHPNILPMYAVCLETNKISLISEYMGRGSLKAIVADTSIPLNMAKKLKIASEIAQGMKFLDSQPDMNLRKHDNLKTNNILIGNDWSVKISDYGQSTIKDLARTMTSIASVAWTAPEILSGEENPGPQIAMYSFAIICWELLTRQVPYAAEHPIRVVAKIVCGYRPTIPTDCPPTFRRTIEQCWANQPHERPSWDTIISNLSTAMHEI